MRSRCGKLAWCALAAAGCGRLDFDAMPELPSGPLVVEPTYAQAARWNDYVRVDRPGRSYLQNGTPCDGSEVGPPSVCIHGGEQRRVVLTGLTSCRGVSAVDALGALQWRCDASGGVATVYSTGLRDGMGLRHLVDATGWKPDAVRVTFAGGQTIASEPAVWWDNPVAPLPVDPTGVVVLDQPSTIYVLDASRASAGVNVDADKIAVVTLPGATLRRAAAPANCNEGTGEVAGAFMQCIVAAGSQQFLWLEGSYDGGEGAEYTMLLYAIRFSRLHGVYAASAKLRAIGLDASSDCVVDDVTAVDGGTYAFELSNSNDNVLHDVRVFEGGTGLATGSSGLILSSSSRNVLTEIVAANNFDTGILSYSTSTANTFSHVTLANHVFDGIDLLDGGGDTLVQVLAVNNQDGVDVISNANTVAQIAAADDKGALCIESASATVRYGLLLGTSSYADCLAGTACGAPTSCAMLAGGPVYMPGFDARGALRFKVDATDTINPSNVMGTAARAAITDWAHFESALRGWGNDGAAFPDATNRSVCAGTCRIWDWRRDTAGGANIAVRDASAAPDTAAIVPGTPCPATVAGDVALSDRLGHTFLVNALEILGDGIGNDDGLCESNEACTRSGYFGADQRTGAPDTGSCVFQDGAVTGVEMHAAP